MVGDTPLSCFVFGNSKITVPFSSVSIIKQYFRKVKKMEKLNPTHKEKTSAEIFLSRIGTNNFVDHQNRRQLSPVVYIYYDENHNPLYVGKSKNIRARHLSHIHGKAGPDKIINECYRYMGVIFCTTCKAMDVMEQIMILIKQPVLNVMGTSRDRQHIQEGVPSYFKKYADYFEEKQDRYNAIDYIMPFPEEEITSVITDVVGHYKEFVFTRKELEEFALPRKVKVVYGPVTELD